MGSRFAAIAGYWSYLAVLGSAAGGTGTAGTTAKAADIGDALRPPFPKTNWPARF